MSGLGADQSAPSRTDVRSTDRIMDQPGSRPVFVTHGIRPPASAAARSQPVGILCPRSRSHAGAAARAVILPDRGTHRSAPTTISCDPFRAIARLMIRRAQHQPARYTRPTPQNSGNAAFTSVRDIGSERPRPLQLPQRNARQGLLRAHLVTADSGRTVPSANRK
jgi:hypothetical protein